MPDERSFLGGPTWFTIGGETTPTVAGGVMPYDDLLKAGVTDTAKAIYIKTNYPDKLAEWLLLPTEEGGGANYLSTAPVVASGLVQLPDGTYWSIADQRIVPDEFAQSLISEAMGVTPSPLPADANWVIPGQVAQLPDGSYVGPNGVPIDPARAQQIIDTYYGAGYTPQTPMPTEPPASGYRWEWDGQGWTQVPGLVPTPPSEVGMTEWQQAQLGLEQQQFGAQQTYQQQQLAFQQQQFQAEQAYRTQGAAQEQRNYLANLMANPASWLEYSMAAGQPAVVQPWMLPLMPGQYDLQAGQVIPGWPGAPTAAPQGGVQPTAPTGAGIPAQAGLWGGTPQVTAPTAPTGAETAAKPYEYYDVATGKPIIGPIPPGVEFTAVPPGGATWQAAEAENLFAAQRSTALAAAPPEQRGTMLEASEARQRIARILGLPYTPETMTDEALTQAIQNADFNPTTKASLLGVLQEFSEQAGGVVGGGVGAPTGGLAPQPTGGTYAPIPATQPSPATQPFATADLWGQSLAGMPELTRPSRQYQARMGPTALAQYYGYRQARTGVRPEEEQWRLWSMAPPGGGYQGLTFAR